MNQKPDKPHSRPSCPCKKLPYYLSSFTAAEHGDVHSLFRRGVDSVVNRQDSAGNTPLHLAAQHGHVAATAALLSAGCNVNGYIIRGSERTREGTTDETSQQEPPERRSTPLHRACFSGAIGTIQLLLQVHDCDLLVKDTSFGDRMTPLHKAVSGGRYLAVQLLLEAHRSRGSLGDALAAKDASGSTPLDLAQSKCPNSAVEKASVARWDSVAGTEPDWESCVKLLLQAEQEVNNPRLPIRPTNDTHNPTSSRTTHLISKSFGNSADQDCGDCGPDGACLTSSWERSFWSALDQQTLAVVREVPLDNPKSGALASSPLKPFSTGTNTPLDTRGAETMVQGHSISIAPQDPVEKDTGSNLGAICGRCGIRTIVLYPTRDGKTVCKKCRKKPMQR